MTFTVAVDAMGGDLGPRVAFRGCVKAVERFPDLHILLFVHEENKDWLQELVVPSSIEVCFAAQAVQMDDKPSQVLRRKRQSTMALALTAVADGKAHACLSSGNSGALMALSRSILKTHLLVDRPALATDIPADNGHFLMLDLGANIQPGAEQMFQFALMGDAWARAQGKQAPSLGLLNIGKEAIKGTEEVQLVARRLEEQRGLNYCGFVEGDELYTGAFDIVVCDGFSGNIALKTSEGLIHHMSQSFQGALQQHWLGRLIWPLVEYLLNRSGNALNPVANSGAILLGLQQLVIKTHGNSDESAFFHSIEYALQQIRADVMTGFVQNMDDFDQ